MPPKLTGIDHVHVYVANRKEAADWYKTILGFTPVETLLLWATETGPLTLEDPQGTIHLALFERADYVQTSTLAFGATGKEFLAWKKHLQLHALKTRLADHTVSFSLYFNDPYGNMHEITTYAYDFVAGQLE